MKSMYEILGVAKDATVEQIRRAYKRKIARTHPDKGGTAAAAAEVNLAYDVLMSPQRRLRYDHAGETRLASGESAARDMITSLFLSWLVGPESFSSENPVRAISGKIDQDVLEASSQIGNLNQTLARARKRLKRLKSKSNWILPRLESEIEKGRLQLGTLESNLDTLKLARELLKDFDFESEPVSSPYGNIAGIYLGGSST